MLLLEKSTVFSYYIRMKLLTLELIQLYFYLKDGELYTQNRRYESLNHKPVTILYTGKKRSYCYTGVGGYRLGIHRIVWALTYGYIPKELDHIDRDPTNNHISNLREVTHAENCLNREYPIASNTGHRGIYKTRHNDYIVRVIRNKKTKYLPRQKTLEDAVRVREEYLRSLMQLPP